MKQSIFICGTDTDVGKTLVGGSLLAFFHSKGIKAGGFKPLESGCISKKNSNELIRPDSSFLKKMGHMKEPIEDINPYAFKEAITPALAAQRAKKAISFPFIKTKLNNLQKNYEILLVEGAGGLLAPVNNLQTNLDLIKFLKIPVLIVARLGLGTINHTLLTLNYLKTQKVKVLGVILNKTKIDQSLASKTNPELLRRFGVPLLGIFPHVKNKTNLNLIKAAKAAGASKLIR